MGTGDQTPTRLPGPFRSTRGKSAGEQPPAATEAGLQLRESIKDNDWSQLESNYIRMMDQHQKSEEELRNHITGLLGVFTRWSQTSVQHDETRALKRFKTQMHHVQNSEESLEKKRKHYMDVVKAFESALALLNDRVRP
ncbi:uncharacterized protein BDV14DRAFT_100950 [Aspergillus stella-maris]|uniref:uncharacterized protein n=1 Tax=Aspergillus stella-maris TaxID=1810926 RepID=UPI003CCE381E